MVFIVVTSEPATGTEFRVYLPADIEEVAVTNAAKAATSHPRGHGEVILLIDDEQAIRQVAERVLIRSGYQVLTASNGAEALAVFAKNWGKIDLVLTDMSMPVMDGPTTTVALRALDPSVKIIGTSGLNANGNVARAVEAGVSTFIPKPYTAEVLLQAVRKELDRVDLSKA